MDIFCFGIGWKSKSEVSFEGYQAHADYDFIQALSLEPAKEKEGTFGGSPVIWSTLNDVKNLHYYYTYNSTEKLTSQYTGYAINGEDVKLVCGLHVGMTAQEAETIVPGIQRAANYDWPAVG